MKREPVVVVVLLLVGLLNLLPALVAIDPARSAALYGIALDDVALGIAMRHRAVLLGAIGLGLIVAVWRSDWRTPALALALCSKIGFLAFYALYQMPSGPLQRVALADVVALVLLGLVLLLRSGVGQRPAAPRGGEG
jgi:hypothetical protein